MKMGANSGSYKVTDNGLREQPWNLPLLLIETSWVQRKRLCPELQILFLNLQVERGNSFMGNIFKYYALREWKAIFLSKKKQ